MPKIEINGHECGMDGKEFDEFLESMVGKPVTIDGHKVGEIISVNADGSFRADYYGEGILEGYIFKKKNEDDIDKTQNGPLFKHL